MCSVYAYSLGRILISDLVVTNLFMHSLLGMILLYLAMPFFTLKVFLHEMKIYTCVIKDKEFIVDHTIGFIHLQLPRNTLVIEQRCCTSY